MRIAIADLFDGAGEYALYLGLEETRRTNECKSNKRDDEHVLNVARPQFSLL